MRENNAVNEIVDLLSRYLRFSCEDGNAEVDPFEKEDLHLIDTGKLPLQEILTIVYDFIVGFPVVVCNGDNTDETWEATEFYVDNINAEPCEWNDLADYEPERIAIVRFEEDEIGVMFYLTEV